MIAIEDLQLAAALLRESSLSAAARALDVTPPALSMRLRRLEAELGLSLANRSARRLALTPEGERFAREARSEEHTSELQSQSNLVCRLLLEKKKKERPRPIVEHTKHRLREQQHT